jgi:hypothetical protein
MAEKNESKQDAGTDAKNAAESASKKSKKPLVVAGGTLSLLALAYMLSTMAIPAKKETVPQLEGPFVAKLSKTEIQVNLSGESSKRYLVMGLIGEYSAYDEAYVGGRLGIASAADGGHGATPVEDPLYTAMLKDAMLKLAATRTRDQVTDPVKSDAFLEDVRRVVDPLLFPVYVGDSHSHRDADSVSGLRAGESIFESKMRGLLHEHELHVDAGEKTIALDDGPTVEFEGRERDLKLTDKAGQTVYVDVTQLKPEFVGTVPVGVPGKLRRIYRDSFLVQ